MIKKSMLAMAGTIGPSGTAVPAKYPDHPINMIIPFGPDGTTDISARAISGPRGTVVGQPLVIASVVGATGSIAATSKPETSHGL